MTENITDEEVAAWAIREQSDWVRQRDGELPKIEDSWLQRKTPAWHFIDNETSYRRGFCQGIAYAVEQIDRLRRDGFSRSSEVSNILDHFLISMLMPWRYGLVMEYRDGRFVFHGGHPSLKQEAWCSIRERVMVRDGHRCQLCGSNKRLEIDHIEPVCNGGLPTDDNLRVLCKPCNLEKSGG